MSTSEGGKGSGKPRSLRAVRTTGPDQSGSRATRTNLGLEPEREAALIAALADLTLTRNEIARRAGVGMATVTRYAEKHGRSFDRRHTEVAVQSRSLDFRARRVELANLLVEDAHRERQYLADLPRTVVDPDTGEIKPTSGMERAQLARTVATLSRAVVELDAAERDRARLDADQLHAAGVDDYLTHLSGEATA